MHRGDEHRPGAVVYRAGRRQAERAVNRVAGRAPDHEGAEDAVSDSRRGAHPRAAAHPEGVTEVSVLTRRAWLGVALLVVIVPAIPRSAQQPASSAVKVTRFTTNPLVTVKSSSTLGANVNGPTVIRVAAWVERPLGTYYMYFGNHRGDFIRLAYADSVTGPWTIHEPGVWHVRDSALNRPQPDSARFGGFNTHFASPETFIDTANRRIVLWAHGWYTNGEHWPTEPKAAQQWANERGYGQFSQAAVSSDGLSFKAQPAITKESYLRVFARNGALYGMSR